MGNSTPGPWHASAMHFGAAYDIGADDGSNIALVSGCAENGAAEFKANARLISSAPDLLEACKAVVPHVWVAEGDQALGKIVEQVRAAIAKAEGREP